MDIGGWIFLAVVVALAAWVIAIYNGMVTLRNRFKNAFAQIDVQLKRRYDLIPNLVDVARKYVQHERDTLEAVIAARNGARSARDAAAAKPADAARIAALAGAEGTLAGLLNKLNVVVEAYPALKADGTLRELSEELNHTENRIAFARQAFNDVVLEYNNAAQQAPTNVVAGVFSFQPAAMLESTASDAERTAPWVNMA
mgnify:FL=1